jgi:hypothetical protein
MARRTLLAVFALLAVVVLYEALPYVVQADGKEPKVPDVSGNWAGFYELDEVSDFAGDLFSQIGGQKNRRFESSLGFEASRLFNAHNFNVAATIDARPLFGAFNFNHFNGTGPDVFAGGKIVVDGEFGFLPMGGSVADFQFMMIGRGGPPIRGSGFLMREFDNGDGGPVLELNGAWGGMATSDNGGGTSAIGLQIRQPADAKARRSARFDGLLSLGWGEGAASGFAFKGTAGQNGGMLLIGRGPAGHVVFEGQSKGGPMSGRYWLTNPDGNKDAGRFSVVPNLGASGQ